jgi:branched-chain amino acid transport system ATP-binding protein
MLKVSDVHAGYAGSEVLFGVSLEVADGEGVVVLGPNGHGKTTLLRVISGLMRPTAGTVEFDGAVISEWRPDQIAGAGIVHIPQGDMLFPEMTVYENLGMGAYVKSAWRERASKLKQVEELFPWLSERKDQLARTLSGGERRMLALARGLMGRARMLLIDEPSLGLAPRITEEIYEAIRLIKETGLAILLVDENANHIAGLADRVYLLESGEFVRQGPADRLLADEALLAAYLG